MSMHVEIFQYNPELSFTLFCFAFAGLPMSERFSFCLTTMLSDVITKDPSYRDQVCTCKVGISWVLGWGPGARGPGAIVYEGV